MNARRSLEQTPPCSRFWRENKTLPTVEFAPISKKITPTLDKRSHLCYNKLTAIA